MLLGSTTRMIKIIEKQPNLAEYMQMREDVGWGNGSEEHDYDVIKKLTLLCL